MAKLFKTFRLGWVLCLILSSHSALTQSISKPDIHNEEIRCATDEAVAERMLHDPEYMEFYDEIMFVDASLVAGDQYTPITIPLAFHFDESFDCSDFACILVEVQDQIDALNLAFASNADPVVDLGCPSPYVDDQGNSVASTGTLIDFCLAVPPVGNSAGLLPGDLPITIDVYNGGKVGGGYGAPGWDGVLNIFITNDHCLGISDGIPGRADGDGVTVCAEAFGGPGPQSFGCGDEDEIDGLDTRNNYGLGNTLVHEIGHYLGLYHTFQGGCAGEPASAGGLMVSDTPAHVDPTYNCPSGCLAVNTCGTIAPVANFMNYSDDPCLTMFTEDQAAIMNFVANTLFGDSDQSICQSTGIFNECPTHILEDTKINIEEKFCNSSGSEFPDVRDVVFNSDCNVEYIWTENNYLSLGGAPINTVNVVTGDCQVTSKVYYLNIICLSDRSVILEGGTYTVIVYPGIPADINTLVELNNAGDCVVSAKGGCESYVQISANKLTYIPHPDGPNCCQRYVGKEGEIIKNGDFIHGPRDWVEEEQVPTGTPAPDPFGIICTSNSPLQSLCDAWLGGWQQNSLLSISQTIDLPPCEKAELYFTYYFDCFVRPEDASNGVENIVLNIFIGGVPVITPMTCDDLEGIYGGGSIGPIDVMALGVPTGPVEFVVQGEEFGTALHHLYVDDISLITSGCTEDLVCEFPIKTQCIDVLDPCSCDRISFVDGETYFDDDLQVLPTAGTFTGGETVVASLVSGMVFDPAGTSVTSLNFSFVGGIWVAPFSTLSGTTALIDITVDGNLIASNFEVGLDLLGNVCVACACTLPNETDSPQINTLNPITVCTSGAQCQTTVVSQVTASDDCTPSNALTYAYEIYSDVNGVLTFVTSGTSQNLAELLPIGMYEIRWIVTDGNSNPTEAIQTVEVQDCKAPSLFCIQGISITLSEMSPGVYMAILAADHFDAGSFDNCTPDDMLTFAFSTDAGLESSLTFTCDDAGQTIPVEIHLSDSTGNVNRCTTYVKVNGEACTRTAMASASLSGSIIPVSNLKLEEVQLSLQGESEEKSMMINGNEEYAFTDLLINKDYIIRPQQNINSAQGVTTADLVMLQQHILGIQELEDPMQLVAADINKSDNLSASDIVELRKLILGSQDRFSSNTSWRFFLKETTLGKAPSYLFKEVSRMSQIDRDYENIDFLGVKIGDINGTHSTSGSRITETRNAEPFIMHVNNASFQANDLVKVRLTPTDLDIYGLQMRLEHSDKLVFVELSTTQNVLVHHHEEGENIQFLSADGEAQVLQEITLTYKAKTSGSIIQEINISKEVQQEAIAVTSDMNVADIMLSFTDHEQLFEVMQNVPNPFQDQTDIAFIIGQDDRVTLEIFSVDGKTIYRHEEDYSAGMNSIIIDSQKVSIESGIYYYRLTANRMQQNRTMIKLAQ